MGANSTKHVTFQAPIEKVYQAITDFESYPEFVEGVDEIVVHDRTETSAKVEYSINMVKDIRYTLAMKMEKPTKVEWTFDSGDLFEVNQGHWYLTDNGDNTTDVEYHVEVDIKGFIPMAGKIVKKLTEVNLPNMLKAYEERAQSL